MAEAETKKWDYRIVASPDEAELAVLGDDGWELAAVSPAGAWVFKRPQPSFRDRVTLEQKARYYGLWGLQREAQS